MDMEYVGALIVGYILIIIKWQEPSKQQENQLELKLLENTLQQKLQEKPLLQQVESRKPTDSNLEQSHSEKLENTRRAQTC